MQSIELHIKGTPHGRPRPRAKATMVNGKWIGQIYQPKRPKITGRSSKADKAWAKACVWYDAVLEAMKPVLPEAPWTGPIHLDIDCYFERPKSLSRKKDPDGPIRHTAKPDRDNLDKAVLDALKEAGLFKDDSQVCDGAVRKWYAAKGCGPGVILAARQIAAVEEEACL